MGIPVLDRSNYLKGLLITARKDNQLSESEKKIIRGIAERLGFASDFYEDTLNNLLANQYIAEDPIKFSNKRIAESFVSDGLKLAFSDNDVINNEIKWLQKTAEINDLEKDWFERKIRDCRELGNYLVISDFALLSLI
jgi:uncharacterized tellurite resistance protein B-like protein